MLILDAEVEGHAGQCVRITNERVAEIGRALRPRPGEPAFDARGGALLPGLHDHHIHLFAAARAMDSIECGPPRVRDEAQLTAALREAARRGRGGGTLRGIGYHESVAGPLRAERLDDWIADRPLRIQHRTGSLWMLNRAAMAQIAAPPHAWPEGAERDAAGRPTGRFFRLDVWLREQTRGASPVPVERPALGALSQTLAAFGVTGVTDTTPTLDDEDAAAYRDALEAGELRQRCLMMGSEALGPVEHPRLARGPLKLLLDEHALPALADLVDRVRAAHDAGRGVAMHCVTRVELAFALGAFEEAGAIAGDRIEHASVAPPEWVELIAKTPIAIVTQPHFVYERGDAYLTDVDPADRPWLYRARAWLDAGVPLAGGSDAPYGHADPWRSMSAAVTRRTKSGRAIGAAEALEPEAALALYTSDPARPGARQRRVEVGGAADLVLLDAPWSIARDGLEAGRVALTLCGGRPIYARDQGWEGERSASSSGRDTA